VVDKVNTMNLMKVGLLRVSVLAVMSLGLMSGAALAESEHDHMNMDHEHMNHEQMDHAHMDMSAHDHSQHQAMLAKKGVLSRTVATYDIPDVKLLDASGAEVSLRTVFDGKEPAILNFIFTTCTTICPVMSATFEQVQAKLGKKRSQVRMVSISIDPENDTPAKLKDYAARFHADKNWQMLTGSVANSVAVQRAFDVAVADKMNHKAAVFIRAKGRDASWVKLDGLVSAADVVAELKKSAK
jgi:protein SCO1/2